MALPFYNQGDQDIYASGDHFIPQEQYRLNYTPSQSLASTIGNTGGVTGAQAAASYIYPQGGGGGGGGFSNTNKYGLDLNTMKTIDSGQWVNGNYEKKSRNIAKDAAGNWKDVDTNQNPYHANIGFKGMIGTVMDKVMGKKSIPGVPDEGSWTGAEWDEDFDETVSGKKLNTYQRWKAKKEFVAAQEKAAADKIAASKAAVKASGADVGHYDPQAGGASHLTRGRDQGGLGLTQSQAQSVSDANKDAGYSSFSGLAQGGRIGLYEGGDAEDYPENESENIFEFMRDQDIPISEEVEGGPTEEQIAMVMDMDGKGMDMETISSVTQLGKETIMNILGVEMANGGLAGLL